MGEPEHTSHQTIIAINSSLQTGCQNWKGQHIKIMTEHRAIPSTFFANSDRVSDKFAFLHRACRLFFWCLTAGLAIPKTMAGLGPKDMGQLEYFAVCASCNAHCNFHFFFFATSVVGIVQNL
jgi:hypothetical protein